MRGTRGREQVAGATGLAGRDREWVRRKGSLGELGWMGYGADESGYRNIDCWDIDMKPSPLCY
jgi:hypothetical protein